jgi:hypothetical protein
MGGAALFCFGAANLGGQRCIFQPSVLHVSSKLLHIAAH